MHFHCWRGVLLPAAIAVACGTQSPTQPSNPPISITTTSLPGGDVGVPYSQTFTTSGGSGGVRFNLVAGSSLPAGLSLDAANGMIGGIPTAVEAANFSIDVTDSKGQRARAAFAIQIAPAPQLGTALLPDSEVGAPYSALIATSGGTPPFRFGVAAGSALPAWLALNATSGGMTGTPSDAAVVMVAFTATDSVGGTASNTYTLSTVPALAFDTVVLPHGQAGVTFSEPCRTTGGRGPVRFELAAGSTLPAGLMLDALTGRISGTPTAAGTFSFAIAAVDSLGGTATRTYVVTIDEALPPNPADLAPPPALGIATDVKTATSFLYTKIPPIQTGVAPGTIELQRAAVIRGKALRRDGTALSGVRISVRNHPEFGLTSTRQDGMFDMAVNGGGRLTVDYEKAGFLRAQRQLQVDWQDYTVAPDVALVELDPAVTAVALGSASPQVAKGSLVTDSAGQRRASVLFPAGTTATMTLADRTTRTLAGIQVRATEYTVGDSGPLAMPGILPPASGYTYAVELSADEALAAGATAVRFNQPIVFHLENFLGFDVGTAVPVGTYDRDKVAWVPVPNGRVIRIQAITDGLAEVDTVGSGSLPALVIDEAERRHLASLYAVGQTLWRVSVAHFSTYDCNWPYGPPPCTDPRRCPGPPPGGGGGGGGSGHNGHGPNDDCKHPIGSSVSCYAQTLGEDVAITGTGFKLHYDSERVIGRKENYRLSIPVTGENLSVPPPKRIELEVEIAGRLTKKTFAAAPNLTETFEWDGRDAYGRALIGWHTATVRIGNVYDAVYRDPADIAQSFGLPSDTTVSGSRARQEVTIGIEWRSKLARHDSRIFNLAGWSLSAHHLYDPAGRMLFQGFGGQRDAAGTTAITIFAGGPNDRDGLPATETKIFDPLGIAAAPDGSVYISEAGITFGYGPARIRRVGADGIVSTFAGTGQAGFSGDGGPALAATFSGPTDLALAPDGSLYVADQNNLRVRKIGPDGVITTVAGNGQYASSGDGGPATLASFNSVRSIALATDGSLYVLDTIDGRVRRVAPDGTIEAFAGAGPPSAYEGDGGPATRARFSQPQGIAVGPDGSVYVADTQNSVVRRVAPDGIISTFAGTGTAGATGDGGPATAAQLQGPRKLGVDRNGNVYIIDLGRIRVVDANGIIATAAGGGRFIPEGIGSGQPPTLLSLTPVAIAFDADGGMLIADQIYGPILRRAPSLRGLAAASILLAGENGTDLYVFDGGGRHLATLDQLTGVLRVQFGYDGQGQLQRITDVDGNQTVIERDGSGQPTAIVSPGNERTALAVDSEGYLSRITDPGGNSYDFRYDGPGGLLTSSTTRRGYDHRYAYDADGRLLRDENPGGAAYLFSRSQLTPTRSMVSMTSPAGRITTYDLETMSTGNVHRIRTDPGGASIDVLERTDGTRRSTYPDGIVADESYGPDPRWGMQSPLLKQLTVTTPGGAVATRKATRTVEMTDAHQPLSLKKQTDRISINNDSFSIVFDAAARTLTRVSAAGRSDVETLDANGHPIQEQFNGLSPMSFAYDLRGRLTQAQHGSQSWTFDYDANHRVSGRTDANAARVAYTHDAASRVSEYRTPGSRAYRLSYDASGNLTGLTMPSLALHSLRYTPLEQEAGYTPPGSSPYVRSYLPDRRLANVTLPGGRVENFGFDAGGRPTGIAYAEASVVLDYAAADTSERIRSMVRVPAAGSDKQSVVYGYDGHLVTGLAASGVANGAYAWEYDSSYNLVKTTLTSGADTVVTSMARDRDGFLIGTGPFSLVRSGPLGAPTEISDGTLTITNVYDPLGRLTRRTHTIAGTVVYAIDLTFDRVGRLSGRTETVAGTSRSSSYAYDADGELVEVRLQGVPTEAYGYDANRNRIARKFGGAPTDSAIYDAQDRLIQQGNVAYQFDADGSLTARGDDQFQYSAAGELLQATASGKTVRYAYDGFRRRVARIDATGVTQLLYGDPEEHLRVTHSRNPAGVLSTYFYDDAGNLFAIARAGSTIYVATDQLGSPRVMTGTDGAVLRTLDYDAFGNVTADSAPDFDLPIGYAAGLSDPVTGLVRFGFRDYDPGVGRWTARDPALFAGRQSNLYVYVNNNPVTVLDPGGLGSIGWSGYSGFGGGFKFSFDKDGVSLCAETGVGLGSSVEIDPFEAADDSVVGLLGELEAELGPLHGKLKGEVAANFTKLSPGDCAPTGEAKVETKACLGTLCASEEVSNHGDLVRHLGVNQDLKQTLPDWAKKMHKAGVQGKLAVKACQHISI